MHVGCLMAAARAGCVVGGRVLCGLRVARRGAAGVWVRSGIESSRASLRDAPLDDTSVLTTRSLANSIPCMRKKSSVSAVNKPCTPSTTRIWKGPNAWIHTEALAPHNVSHRLLSICLASCQRSARPTRGNTMTYLLLLVGPAPWSRALLRLFLLPPTGLGHWRSRHGGLGGSSHATERGPRAHRLQPRELVRAARRRPQGLARAGARRTLPSHASGPLEIGELGRRMREFLAARFGQRLEQCPERRGKGS